VQQLASTTTQEAIPGSTPAEVAWDLPCDVQQDRKPNQTTIYAVRPPEVRREERRKRPSSARKAYARKFLTGKIRRDKRTTRKGSRIMWPGDS
jgi:hypothetical protein